MHCNPLTDPACVAGNLIKSVTGGVTGDVLSGIAQAINSGVEWVVTNTATWWVRIPSPDLAAEPAVTRIQQWLLPIAAAAQPRDIATAVTEVGQALGGLESSLGTCGSPCWAGPEP